MQSCTAPRRGEIGKIQDTRNICIVEGLGLQVWVVFDLQVETKEMSWDKYWHVSVWGGPAGSIAPSCNLESHMPCRSGKVMTQ